MSMKRTLRLDYLVHHGVEIAASDTLALCDQQRSASDHRLVWADLGPNL